MERESIDLLSVEWIKTDQSYDDYIIIIKIIFL